MFMGEYRHNTDSKGRIIVPARFRDELGNQLILTKGLDGCITVYTPPQWDRIIEQLYKLPNTKKESRMYIHMVTSKAAECEVDGAGRILIPQNLLEEAAIKKECVVIGVADHVEIWSSARWEAYSSIASAAFESVAEELTEFVK
ncbi:MAG: cell division protein MraZ [Erysipelotrichaceae bacterium]|nr:MAG: cell division protein [Erysipelotrichaceae bacterium]TXT18929.1 MAG: cell division protein MraZ [Erysipelotrichaceae bacterium]